MIPAAASVDCPVQAECGGCPLLLVGHERELARKRAMVAAAFDAHGLAIDVPLPLTAGSRLGYRNRIRLRVEAGRAMFFNRAKSAGCAVLEPRLWDAVRTLTTLTERRPELLGDVRHLEVRISDESDAPGVVVSDPIDVGAVSAALSGTWRFGWHGQSAPMPRLGYRVADDVSVQVPLSGFVQVNTAVNRLLVDVVRRAASGAGATFIDLFCGAGNLSLPLIADGLSGVAVESHAASVSALAAAAAGTGRLRALSGAVDALLDGLQPADVVVCNPPRAGMKQGHERVALLARQRIVLVGCRPAALAHDAASLAARGFTLRSVQPLDMFPCTEHVETVAVLDRETV